MRIAMVASEAAPFVKTGGLGDVMQALPNALSKLKGNEICLFLPYYKRIKENPAVETEQVGSFSMELAWRESYVGILRLKSRRKKLQVYFIDNDYYFGARSTIYGDFDDGERFAYFSKAVMAALYFLDFKPDILHCHDWQTGLIPVHLKDKFHGGEFFRDIKSVMTIHNLKFQGVWDVKTIQHFSELPDYYFTPDKLEAYKDGNFLKGGIVFADAVTTVSNTYADEIKTPFYGEGLDGLLRARSNSLRGIVNGIDYNDFNPETDINLSARYNATTFRKEKVKNKIQLQKDLGLEQDPKAMMIGIVSRLTDQKGFDLIDCVMDELCQDAVQIVVLGTGDERYENMFRHFAWKYPDKVSAQIYYSEPMSHKIYASCDAFLMPSLFEPCGLSQLMSLRYGTVPIVRETGGLKDTVEAYNEFDKTGTGFSFANYNAHEMLGTIRYAERIYYDKKRDWNKIVERGMKEDFSWKTSAKHYEDLYESM